MRPGEDRLYCRQRWDGPSWRRTSRAFRERPVRSLMMLERMEDGVTTGGEAPVLSSAFFSLFPELLE